MLDKKEKNLGLDAGQLQEDVRGVYPRLKAKQNLRVLARVIFTIYDFPITINA